MLSHNLPRCVCMLQLCMLQHCRDSLLSRDVSWSRLVWDWNDNGLQVEKKHPYLAPRGHFGGQPQRNACCRDWVVKQSGAHLRLHAEKRYEDKIVGLTKMICVSYILSYIPSYNPASLASLFLVLVLVLVLRFPLPASVILPSTPCQVVSHVGKCTGTSLEGMLCWVCSMSYAEM